MNKSKWIWNAVIGVQIVVYIILTTSIFVLQKKIAILETRQGKQKSSTIVSANKNTQNSPDSLALQQKMAEEILKTDSGNSEKREELAMLYYKDGNTESAIKSYTRILETKPNDADVHFKIARLYYSCANREMAQHHFQKVIEISPNHPQAEIVKISLRSIEKKQQHKEQQKPIDLETKKKILSSVQKNLQRQKDPEKQKPMKALIEKLEREIEEASK